MSAMFAGSSGAKESGVKAVVLYDEYASGRRAKAYFDGLNFRSGNNLKVNVSLWRFDVLSLPTVVETSLSEASDADLVGVALQARRTLPSSVTDWLETWAVERVMPDPAVLFVQENPASLLQQNPAQTETLSSQAVSILRQIADRHGLRLIYPQGLDARLASHGFAKELWRREQLITSTLQTILGKTADDPHKHWGINE